MPKSTKRRTKKIVVANWKMNPATLEEAKVIFTRTKRAAGMLARVKVVVCPPAPLISFFVKSAKSEKGGGLLMGAQNCAAQDSGSFTGETSSLLLKNIGAQYVIIGHSERRAMGETDTMIAEKVAAALRNGLIPILCIGEQSHDDEGKYLSFLKAQLFASLQGVSKADLEKVIIAYEPIWAIGAKEPMKAHDIHGMTIFIKKTLAELLGRREPPMIPILYGGSVTFENAGEIVKEGMVDGLLVGRDGLKNEFPRLLQSVNDIA